MFEDNPRVSVIIPTYNRAHMIERSVQSVLNQTYPYIECIVCDDSSTDNTAEVIKKINDPRIIYHRNAYNMGAGGARNEGVRVSTCEYIAFHDSDDYCRPDRIEKEINYMKEHPDVDMVYGKYIYNLPDGRIIEIPGKDVTGVFEGESSGKMFEDLLIRNTVGAPTTLFRKDKFIESGGFDVSLTCVEDWEFAVRFSKNNNIGYIDDFLIECTVNSDGVSQNVAGFYNTRCKMIADNKDALIKLGIFDKVVKDLFDKAENRGIVPQVKEILMNYLSRAVFYDEYPG